MVWISLYTSSSRTCWEKSLTVLCSAARTTSKLDLSAVDMVVYLGRSSRVFEATILRRAELSTPVTMAHDRRYSNVADRNGHVVAVGRCAVGCRGRARARLDMSTPHRLCYLAARVRYLTARPVGLHLQRYRTSCWNELSSQITENVIATFF